MSSFRFIHCSDLHIDSPFKGLSSVHPVLGERLRRSTFQSFQNIVQLAVQERVDAVIVAGDVYDGADKSLQAQLKFRQGMQRLSDAGIPAFVVHGNHDPLDSWSSSLRWPESVKVFSGKQVESFPVRRDGKILARIYGVSFPRRDVRENLALSFTRDSAEGFAVAVLHANVGGHPDHDPYAPCSIEDLSASGMDYWALGHVHARQVLRASDPAIVYPGNAQARNRKEEGEKGCCLVTLRQNAPPDIRFVATDAARYLSGRLDLSPCATVDEAARSIRFKCEETVLRAGGRDALVRLTLEGRTALHQEFKRAGGLEDLLAEVQGFFEGQEPLVWLDLVLETQGTYDVAALGQGKDFIADIVAIYDEAGRGGRLDEIRTVLKPLCQDWQGRKYLDSLLSGDPLSELAVQARNLTLDLLVEDR